jgi:hypothetical protein
MAGRHQLYGNSLQLALAELLAMRQRLMITACCTSARFLVPIGLVEQPFFRKPFAALERNPVTFRLQAVFSDSRDWVSLCLDHNTFEPLFGSRAGLRVPNPNHLITVSRCL